jgi:membrane protein YdbS with pleckstrin-like domain
MTKNVQPTVDQLISPLQQQFPLSPKKYWKKIIPKIIGNLIFCLFLFVMTLAIIGVVDKSLDGYIGGPHTSATLLLLLIPIVVFFIIIAFYSWYYKTYIKRYYYAGEEFFITIKKGVFTPSEIHVQWQKIQDVYVDQDIFDRIMGLYDVHIASATVTSGIEAHIDGVDHATAEGLKEFILGKISNNGSGNFQNTISSKSPQPKNKFSSSPTLSVKLVDEISNVKYPLTKKWFNLKLVSNIMSPFIYWALIGLFIIFDIKVKNTYINIDNIFTIILPIYFMISIISAILQTISLFLWKKNYAFNFTPENIYYSNGVIAISEKNMPYSSIQDVTVQQGFIERLIGLGKVRIANAAQQTVQTSRGRASIFSGIIIQGISIEDANKIAAQLNSIVLNKNSSQYGL